MTKVKLFTLIPPDPPQPSQAPRGFPDKKSWNDFCSLNPNAVTTRSPEQILFEILPSLSPKQIEKLKSIAEGMQRGRGRRLPRFEYTLVKRCRALKRTWEETTDDVNKMTGSNHDSEYYRKLFRRGRSDERGGKIKK